MSYWLTEEERNHLAQAWLRIFLEATVPLAIWELSRRGGPDEMDRHFARQFGEVLASHGDTLLYRSKGKPSKDGNPATLGTAEVAGKMARFLAVMAYQPGGITFQLDEPVHFEAKDAARGGQKTTST